MRKPKPHKDPEAELAAEEQEMANEELDEVQEQPAEETPVEPTEEEVREDGLRAIYEEDGEMPDFTQLDQKQGGRMTRMLIKVIVVLAVISAAAWGGFFLWTSGVFQDSRIVRIEIEGPRDALSGEEVFYTFRYENAGDVPVASMQMKLSIPESFEVTSESPEATEERIWNIGALEAGSDGAVIIGGVFHADVPSNQTLQALLTYKPANFSSEFEEIETVSVAIEESVLDVAVTGPEKALAGDEVSYTINLQNTSAATVENALLTLEIPEDFSFTSAEPAASEEDRPEWRYDSLEPGELVAVTVKGSFTASAAGEQPLKARAHFMRGESRLVQAEEETMTDVLSGTLALNLIVDGSSQDQTAELGEPLLVSLDYANNSADAIKGLTLELNIETPEGDNRSLPLNLEAIDVPEDVRSGGTFRFDPSISEIFKEVNPGDENVIDLAMPILESIDLGDTSDEFVLTLKATLDKVGSIESPRTIETSPVTISLNTDVALTAEARYYTEEGVELGSGPLPPRVDETTKYHIFWKLSNSLHALDDTTVTTILPQDVSWTGAANTDIGNLVYDSTTRMVTWQVNRLPTDVSEATASFEVAIVPAEGDVGSFFKLVNVSTLQTEDTKTGAQLSRSRDLLTTELPADEGAEGKGVVVE